MDVTRGTRDHAETLQAALARPPPAAVSHMLLNMLPALLVHVVMAAGKAAALLWLPQLLLLFLLRF